MRDEFPIRLTEELVLLMSIGGWKEGDVFRATRTFQNHVSSQVSHLTIGVDCSHYMVPANYTLGINPFPTAAPDRKLKFRVAELDPA